MSQDPLGFRARFDIVQSGSPTLESTKIEFLGCPNTLSNLEQGFILSWVVHQPSNHLKWGFWHVPSRSELDLMLSWVDPLILKPTKMIRISQGLLEDKPEWEKYFKVEIENSLNPYRRGKINKNEVHPKTTHI